MGDEPTQLTRDGQEVPIPTAEELLATFREATDMTDGEPGDDEDDGQSPDAELAVESAVDAAGDPETT